MSKELHPVVELLLARMKSHPEEFTEEYLFSEVSPNTPYVGERWGGILRVVLQNGSEVEIEALNEALRPIRLKQAHEYMMDELCNGDERRRKMREEREAEERRYYAMQQAQVKSMPNTPRGFITDYDHATQTMRIKNTHTGAVTAVSHDQLEDKGFVATIKKALGI